jgi:radical SAM protein with 4Fe4S-binding SPASM domain
MKTVVNSGFYEILGTDRFGSEAQPGERFAEYRRRWAEYPQKQIVGDFPLHLDAESTNACNLKCTMCSRNFMKEKIGFMEWGLFKKIVDEGAEHGLPSIKFNFRGEPLMHPRLAEMVKYAKDSGIMDVQFNTNGLLLTGKKSEELIKAGLDRIIFSFDGATKETYERIRTGSDFETVVANIKRLVEIRDGMGLKKPSVRVQMVKTKENAHEVEDFVKMWRDTANRVGIIKAREPIERCSGKTRDDHFVCPQLWQRIVVLWDGDVLMCCGDWHAEYRLGDANKQSIAELWNGDLYNQVRNLHKRGRFNGVAICARCEVNTPLADEGLEALVKRYQGMK